MDFSRGPSAVELGVVPQNLKITHGTYTCLEKLCKTLIYVQKPLTIFVNKLDLFVKFNLKRKTFKLGKTLVIAIYDFEKR